MTNDPRFMILLDERDSFFPREGGELKICDSGNQQMYTNESSVVDL